MAMSSKQKAGWSAAGVLAAITAIAGAIAAMGGGASAATEYELKTDATKAHDEIRTDIVRHVEDEKKDRQRETDRLDGQMQRMDRKLDRILDRLPRGR